MILATVGTTELPFDRLVKAVDQLAGTADETFVIQTGHSTYKPQHAQLFRFATPARMQELIARADVIVTHGGFGTSTDCVRAGKRIVACPRRADLGEAVNPQVELVTYLAERGVVVPLYDAADLAYAIEQARRTPLARWPFQSTIPKLVAEYVHSSSVRGT